MSKLYRLPLTQKDILLIMDSLIFALPPHDFKVGRQYKGEPTRKTEEHLAELYQTIGQAMGEDSIVLEFNADFTEVNPIRKEDR